jgi:DNA replication protein DnaC
MRLQSPASIKPANAYACQRSATTSLTRSPPPHQVNGPITGCSRSYCSPSATTATAARSCAGSSPQGFPRQKWLADFHFDANDHINPATVNTLASGEWVRTGYPLCLIGDSGTGKSHLLIGLGTAAAEKGFRVKYTLATKLVNELVEAADDKALAKTIARYGRVDLLIIDELGYMELDRRGAELLFQVLTEREEKASVAIASNQPFSGWSDTFTDPRLCAAIVDRLTFNGTIIETGTHSYRLAHARQQAP